MDIAVRATSPEMRLCLWTVVKAEDAFNDAAQFRRQLHRSGAPAIRPTLVLELLQVDSECLVELSHAAGQNHGPARRVFLDNCETVLFGELLTDARSAGAAPYRFANSSRLM
jgi:hypothetical protein